MGRAGSARPVLELRVVGTKSAVASDAATRKTECPRRIKDSDMMRPRKRRGYIGHARAP